MSVVEKQLTDTLAFERCLDVAVFALAIARKLHGGQSCASLLNEQLPQEWAIAANVLVTEECPVFEQRKLRQALRRLLAH